ncbi:MAG: ArnT family glycosyltransferase [Thermoanaerobaculia bacterium]
MNPSRDPSSGAGTDPAAPPTARPRNAWIVAAFAAVAICAAATIFTRLGAESLLGDEALYSAIARDSLRADVWFPLRYEQEPYLGKPPLGIWLIESAFRIAGVGEISARAPLALFGFAALLLLFRLAWRRYGIVPATLAALLLGSGHQLLFRHGLRHAVFEGAMLLMAVAAVFALTEPSSSPRRRIVVAAAWGAFGAAFKGLAAPAFLLSFGLAYLLLARRRRPPSFALALAAAIGAGIAVWGLWLLALQLAGVGGIAQSAVRDVVVRASRGIDPGHLQGPWYYLLVIKRELGAWLLLVPLSLLPMKRRPPASPGLPSTAPGAWVLPAAWTIGPALVYSLSVSKLSWYLYPALPGVALLAGLGAATLLAAARKVHPALAILAATGLLILLAGRYESRLRRIRNPPPERVALRLVLDAVRRDPGMVLVFDDPGSLPAPVREWDRFYLGEAPRLAHELDSSERGEGCPILVTGQPATYAERDEFRGAKPVPLYRVTAREAPLFVLDGCGGAVAARLSGPDVMPAGPPLPPGSP